MPKRLFQLVLFTEDIDESVRFLVDVIGMGEPRWLDSPGSGNAQVFGWPEDSDTRRVVLGEGPGMIELVQIPESLRGTVAPGVGMVAFATPDVEGYAERATAAGFPMAGPITVSGPDGPTTLADVVLGGLQYELIRFGS